MNRRGFFKLLAGAVAVAAHAGVPAFLLPVMPVVRELPDVEWTIAHSTRAELIELMIEAIKRLDSMKDKGRLAWAMPR